MMCKIYQKIVDVLILGYLYSFSKTAGKTVVEKAKQISKEVEEKVQSDMH